MFFATISPLPYRLWKGEPTVIGRGGTPGIASFPETRSGM